MGRLTTLMLSALASLAAMAQADCDEGAMQCGRQLIDDEGYTQADLIAILNNTQQPYDNDHIFESIFYCDSSNNGNGWVYYEWCGGQDSCVAGGDGDDAGCAAAVARVDGR
ncbi:hypothetical protein B0H65DRAFT_439738 [Neurospora tetraspora]|uniref:Uncharacterized protein n=1 Tax=Neurospora tetraspora TaxID=94610 RepID=A0AAE0JJC6_9PEZI|nr:hypothetical protein B0H65DRAFT_439738 [Neurospora tetraspora]